MNRKKEEGLLGNTKLLAEQTQAESKLFWKKKKKRQQTPKKICIHRVWKTTFFQSTPLGAKERKQLVSHGQQWTDQSRIAILCYAPYKPTWSSVYKQFEYNLISLKDRIFAVGLPDHGLKQWLITRWEGMANTGSSGANNTPVWAAGEKSASTPPHPHLRVSSQGSSTSLDRGCTSLELLLEGVSQFYFFFLPAIIL